MEMARLAMKYLLGSTAHLNHTEGGGVLRGRRVGLASAEEAALKGLEDVKRMVGRVGNEKAYVWGRKGPARWWFGSSLDEE